jgi:hypothetical protein
VPCDASASAHATDHVFYTKLPISQSRSARVQLYLERIISYTLGVTQGILDVLGTLDAPLFGRYFHSTVGAQPVLYYQVRFQTNARNTPQRTPALMKGMCKLWVTQVTPRGDLELLPPGSAEDASYRMNM